MLFFYIRHGDPIYDPDSLTPLGLAQADAAAKRLALYGLDKIYASTSNRAQLTAKPTCDLLKMDMEVLDFCNEKYTWQQLTVDAPCGKDWMFQDEATKLFLASKEIKDLADKWYDHPEIKHYNFEKGIERIYTEGDKFFESLGYAHERGTGKYKILHSNNDRVALFAHQGFGLAFLSCILDIPYPEFVNHFDMCHSGITVIEFCEHGEYAIPKILTLSSDAHLYREGLPTKYANKIYF